MSIIIKAREFARKHHQGQFRKWKKDPYFVHPERVAIETLKLPYSTEEMVAAAYLHDLVEDTDVTFEDISKEFGPEIAKIVRGLTSYSKQVSISGVRAIRKLADHRYLGDQCYEVKILKLLDRLDNLKDMINCCDNDFLRLYFKETKDLLAYIGHANKDLTKQILHEIWWTEQSSNLNNVP